MSEHPPIPAWAYVEACGAIGYDESAEIWPQLEAIIKACAPVLWREWTRGMAVVPLPEPDRGGFIWDVADHEVHALRGVGGPLVAVGIDAFWTYMSADLVRMRARAELAAADRAEQLAAEAKAVNP